MLIYLGQIHDFYGETGGLEESLIAGDDLPEFKLLPLIAARSDEVRIC